MMRQDERRNRLGIESLRAPAAPLLFFALAFFLSVEKATAATTEEINFGKKVYQKRCIFCHGDAGGGDGVAAERFRPRPRDFVMGFYKYRSTPNGMNPTDADLFRVVSDGLPGTGMPAWKDLLSEEERRAVVAYIKTFSKRFERQSGPLPLIEVGPEISSSKESIEKGKALFRSLECFKCHGNEGRGDGPSALTLTDDKGDPILPRDLTLNWHFRGGPEAKDVYMRINTGLNGTPMPSFRDSLDNEKSWHLAHYVRSLSPAVRPALNVVIRSKRVGRADLPTDPNDPFWQKEESAAWFPMVGQVIREPRHFTPTVRDIFVRSVYNDREIAFLLIWNDPSKSQAGMPLPVVGSGDTEEDLFGEESDEAPTATAFDDAVAVQFPGQRLKGLKKPYFLMGDEKHPVNLWTFKGGKLFESNARGIDKETVQPVESQAVKGSGIYGDGQYKVVMKRALQTGDVENDIQFEIGHFTPIAFYLWDGHNGETASKRSLSHWYFVLLEPKTPKEVYIYPPLVAAVVLGFQLLLQRRLRKNNGYYNA